MTAENRLFRVLLVMVCIFAIASVIHLYDKYKHGLANALESENDVSLVIPVEAHSGFQSEVLPEASPLDSLVQELKSAYGENIFDPAIQAQLYRDRSEILQRYPNTNVVRFQDALKLAFPDEVGSITLLFKKLDAYFSWLQAHQAELEMMPDSQRVQLVWAKRYEIFQSDADIIWSSERDKLVEVKRLFEQTVSTLDSNSTITSDEKLYQLKSRVEEITRQQTVQLGNAESTLAQVFFSMPSVQDELASLPAGERQRKINSFRQRLGFSQAQVQQMEDRDQQRNARWQKGLKYMHERGRLTAAFSGELLEKKLNELRTSSFGFEAETLRREEESGFFRYSRPRVYGRNS